LRLPCYKIKRNFGATKLADHDFNLDDACSTTVGKLRSGAEPSELRETHLDLLLPDRAAVEKRISIFVDRLNDLPADRRGSVKDDLIWTLRRIYEGPGNLPSAALPMAEMVVIADGSRPVFFFEDGRLTGGAGNGPFFDAVQANASLLEQAGPSIGRIESDLRWKQGWMDKWYGGTAFLVAPNLLMTNRHVAQELVNEPASTTGPFSLNGPYWINFEAEFGTPKRRRFKIAGVRWMSQDIIQPQLDISRLDIALLDISDAEDPAQAVPATLPLCLQPPAQGEAVFVTGYPGKPKLATGAQAGPDTELETVLARLFDNRFAGKRCASGEVDAVPGSWADDVRRWTIKHDASTLNGSSGSPVISLSRGGAPAVLALHFGGESRTANNAQVLDSLRAILEQAGARIV
jgi:hypothetical protein